jgi:hypothetical protein
MLTANATEEIPLSADRAWEVIGKFDEIRRWAIVVQGERCEQTPEGRIRTLLMPPDGREVRELLVAEGPHSYTYQVLGAANAPKNFGTVSVVPVDDARSRIELKSEFEVPAGLDADEALANKNKFLRGNLKAMKRALGLA